MDTPCIPARRTLALAVTALVLLIGLPDQARANDDIILIQFLQSTGADGDARAKARWRDKGDSLDFQVEIEKVPQGGYELLVAGVQQGVIQVGGTGEGEIEFETPQDDDKPLFDFEVFDQVLEIRQGATVFFSDTFAPGGSSPGGGGPGGGGSGGGGGNGDEIEIVMVNVGPDFNAKGRLRYRAESDETRFEVKTERLDAGVYDVLVDGEVKASFDSTGFHEVDIDFRNPPDDDPDDDADDGELEIDLLLDFDPLGSQVDVVRGATTYLSAFMPESQSGGGIQPPKKVKDSAEDLGKKKADKLRIALFNTGVLPGAEGKATLGQNGELEFEVEVEDVADGDYTVCVAGTDRGTLSVVAGQGELEFSDQPEATELLLDFAVKGELIEVKSGEDVLLAAVFPLSVQEALALFSKEKRTDKELRVNLFNAALDLDTRGEARHKLKGGGRREFRVDVQDLPAGDYAVHVDGIERGALAVTAKGKAKLRWDTKPGGKKLPLDFDVLGMLVEVVDGEGAVVLQTLME